VPSRARPCAQAFVLELLRFGAVFCSVVPPAVPAEAARGMSAELAARSAAARAAAEQALDAVRRPGSVRSLAGWQ
jgi:predicted methyltransferase